MMIRALVPAFLLLYASAAEAAPQTASGTPAAGTTAETASETTAAEAATPETPAPEAPAADAPAEAPTAGAELHRFERRAMGTEVQLLIYTKDKTAAAAAADAAVQEIQRVESLMSDWKSDSEIGRLNQSAGGAPVKLSADTIGVLELAKSISAKTGGAFTPTWAALAGVWNFDVPEGQTPIIPDEASIKERLSLVDDSQLILTPDSAQLAKEGMAVGLAGITKGHAVDRAQAVLKERGFENTLVFVGGDIASSGKKGTLPWVVGLQEPRATGDKQYFAVLPLEDEAIATSGDYESYFEVDGKRYHHLLDPRSGQPAFGTRSVSVIAKDAASADAFATAIFILGPEQGLALAERTPGLETVIVDGKNQVTVSSGLAKRLRILHQPLE